MGINSSVLDLQSLECPKNIHEMLNGSLHISSKFSGEVEARDINLKTTIL